MNTNIQKIIASISFLLLLIALWQLGTFKKVSAIKAVYWWKTSFDKNTYSHQEENKFIEEHQINKMYVKLLDIDYNESAGIFPVSKTKISYYPGENGDSIEYVPVMYITNEVLKHLDSTNIDYYTKIFIGHALRIETYTGRTVNEIQIDCDWTKGTKVSYFKLLKCMQKWAPQYQYSVTLRLFPYKYRAELGIPPVNRVMLMVYNIDNARNYKQANSIFNVNEAAKYLRKKDYPLPMDYALPVFSWTLIYRNQQFLKVFSSNIVSEISNNRVAGYNDSTELFRFEPNLFLVVKPSKSYNEYSLKAGDILKVEICGEKELTEASLLISRLPFDTKTTIALFDLDANDLEKISYEKIETAYAPFR